jgi:hypothetical protein
MRQATIGRNAAPVIAGVKPRVCCRIARRGTAAVDSRISM